MRCVCVCVIQILNAKIISLKIEVRCGSIDRVVDVWFVENWITILSFVEEKT